MTKYKINLPNTTIEFSIEQEATSYITENSLDCQIIAFESQTIEPVIPDVTPRQIRQALILSGVSMESIEAALATLSSPTKELAQAEWEYSISFQRNRQLVNDVGLMLGWTSEQLDNLWIFAGTL